MQDMHLGQLLIGPTGHTYRISEPSFRSNYSNYLQSFEFGLLAQGTIQTLKRFPTAEVIGHFHDGNVLVIPEGSQDHFLSSFNEELDRIRRDLRLSYPQKVEMKRLYN